MTVVQNPDKVIMEASKDLSDFQNMIMMVDADGQVVESTGETVHPIGILINAPSSQGEDAHIKANGVIDVVMLENCDEGEAICADPAGSGKGTVADADGDFCVGIALTANTGGSGGTASIQIQSGLKAVGDENS